MSVTGCESMNAARFTALLHPSQTNTVTCRQPWGWERGLHHSSPLRRAAVWVQEMLFFKSGGVVGSGSGAGDLACSGVIKLLSDTFPPPGCLRYFSFSLAFFRGDLYHTHWAFHSVWQLHKRVSCFCVFRGVKNSRAFDFSPARTSKRGNIHS